MKFKCLATGCVYEFTSEVDIAGMLTHPQYVMEEEVKPVEPKVLTKAKE